MKKEIILNVTNVYNRNNKSLEDLKIEFNRKLLNMIYNLEKNSFFRCENQGKNDIMNMVEC